MRAIPLQHTVFPLFLTAGALFALAAPLGPWVGGAVAAAWVAGMGWMLGSALLPDAPAGWRAFFGSLTFVAGTTVVGSVIYLLWNLGGPATGMIVVISSFAAASWASWAKERKLPFGTADHASADAKEAGPPRNPFERYARAGLGAAAVITALALTHWVSQLLAGAATDDAIRSPWEVAPRMLFAACFMTAVLAFSAAHGGLAPRLSLLATGALTLLTACVAVLTYEIGYGFDPFLHRAAEEAIFAQGFIDPKPFYYVGQYAVVTMLARFMHGGVAAIDAMLVPAALTLVVPCAYYALRRGFGLSRSSSAAAAMGVLLLPLSSFAATTPQGFANAVFLMTAFLAIPAALGTFPLAPLALLAAAAAAIHPLAGVPLAAFVALLIALRMRESQHRTGIATLAAHPAAPWILALGGGVALPAMFVLNSVLSGASAVVDTEALRQGAGPLSAFAAQAVPTRRFDLFLDFVYSWKAMRAAAFIVGGAIGVALLRRRTRSWLAWALGAAVFAGNWLLMKSFVRLPFLIAYEQSSYADRVYELGMFLLAPAALVATGVLLERVRTAFPALRIGVTALVAALAVSSLYLAYPRRDQYQASRGWSIGAADAEAVRAIAADAKDVPYVTLANQAVSAAAVREFGFRKYYYSADAAQPGPVFFYPIPTGGPLYAIFLDMNEGLGDREIAERAMDLAGVDVVYYVVNHYWWDARRITVNARREADRAWTAGGKDYVFKYVRK